MRPFRRILERRQASRQLTAEMRSHIEERTDDLIESGHTPEEAHRLACIQFGNAAALAEDAVEQWGWTALINFLADLRYGWRVLCGSPTYTLTVVAVLALSIGMNTAMFSIVKRVLLSQLPYRAPEQLVALWQTSRTNDHIAVSGADFQDWRTLNSSLQNVAAYGSFSGTLSGKFEPLTETVAAVSAGFFETLGTSALAGRIFSAQDQQVGAAHTIVLGHSLSQRLFGDPASALNQTVHFNGLEFTVIGVMPTPFDFPNGSQAWIANDSFPFSNGRSAHNYRVIARLRPDVSIAHAQADLDIVASRLGQQYPDDHDLGIRVVALQRELVGKLRPALLALFGAVTLVLLIACVNTSGLQLARASARSREYAVRVSLGASRSRLIAQSLTESLLLAAMSGACSIALTIVLTQGALRLADDRLLPWTGPVLDLTILGFTAIISIGAALLFGILPALRASRILPGEAIKDATGKGVSRRRLTWGQALVATQLGLTIVLLSATFLLLKSYSQLTSQPTVIDVSNVFYTDLTWPANDDGNSVDPQFVRQAAAATITEIRNLPKVENVSLAHGLAFAGVSDGNFEIAGRPLPADPHQAPDADYALVDERYFPSFRVPVIKGRNFDDHDLPSGPPVVLINRTFERQFFPNQDPLGQRIHFLGMERVNPWMTIIGVVPDIHADGLRQPLRPEAFVNYLQHAGARLDATLVVRGPAALQPAIKRIIQRHNRETAVDFQSMERLIAGTVSNDRFTATLLLLFGASALLLSVVGIYGLLSYLVNQRTGEFGVRLALGARRFAIQSLVLRQSLWLILIGSAAGLIGALLIGRTLQSLLYQVSATDPLALLAALLALAAATLLASWIPARRASRVDPSVALRQA